MIKTAVFKNTFALVGRDIKLFLRDKATVFFSFLSSIIMVLLYFLFLAKIYIGAINGQVSGVSPLGSGFVVYLQMIAGILVLNSMSLTLGVFSSAARDFEGKRADSLMTTPLKPQELLLSYIISGFLVSVALNLFSWVLSVVLIGAVTGFWITVGTFFLSTAALLVASLVSSSIMMLITVLVRSSAAIGVISGIAGTFMGFICGIYMPYSSLGNGMKTVGSFLPFTHLTIWLKQIVLNDAFSQLNIDASVKEILLDEYFAAKNVGFCGLNAPLWLMLLASGLFAFSSLALAWFLMQKRLKNKGVGT